MKKTYSVTAPEGKEILKVTKVYHDAKTQVPKRVLELLRLKPGRSNIVWVWEKDRVYIESAVH